jgi:hypothetical protein
MPVFSRRTLLSVAAGGLFLAAGCDLAALTYFILPEQRQDAKMKHLASDEKDKNPKVVILTWGGFEMRSEFIHADRQLAEMLARELRRHADENKEKLTIVSARSVEEFKSANPNWRGMPLPEIGRRFGADHVLYLEINSLSLYEPGSLNTLLRGRISLNMTLADVAHPDDSPLQQPFVCTYPGDAPGALPADNEATKVQFRQAFLTHVSRKLGYYFSKHGRQELRNMDRFSDG